MKCLKTNFRKRSCYIFKPVKKLKIKSSLEEIKPIIVAEAQGDLNQMLYLTP